jgi:tRNA threonylcarbamoyl adenosine modification protein YeaZ
VLVLLIDTSSAAVTAAVAKIDDGVEVLAKRVTIDARAHGELLAPSIENCLGEAGCSVADVGAVVVGVGPGPFTGLRVGLVTAAVFAEARRIPAYGVCSLDAIAGALAEPDLLVAGDARRREVYWARYVDGVRVAGPSVDRPADVPTDAAAMTGAGARVYRDVLARPLLDVDYPSPLALARAAAERVRTGAPSEPLTPLYLRRPDAVEPGPSKTVTQ